MKQLLLCLAVAGLFQSGMVWGQTNVFVPPPKPTVFRAALEIRTGSISNLLKSYLSRELRSLGDVEVVDEKPHYTIIVLCESLALRGSSTVSSYAMSVVVTTEVDPALNCVVLNYCALDLVQADKLKEACAKRVAEFDTQVLDEARKTNRFLRSAETRLIFVTNTPAAK